LKAPIEIGMKAAHYQTLQTEFVAKKYFKEKGVDFLF